MQYETETHYRFSIYQQLQVCRDSNDHMKLIHDSFVLYMLFTLLHLNNL